MKAQTITHKGRIVSISPEITKVEIISESACASCHAKSICGAGESQSKIVEVPTSGWDNYSAGDEVTLELKASMGHKAVWVAYCIPLIVLVAALLVCLAAGTSELEAGLIAIGSVALYYVGIALFGGRLKNEYNFSIKQ